MCGNRGKFSTNIRCASTLQMVKSAKVFGAHKLGLLNQHGVVAGGIIGKDPAFVDFSIRGDYVGENNFQQTLHDYNVRL